MNRKNNKKIVKTAVIFLFFLAGGVWYLLQSGVLWKERTEQKLISVLENREPEVVSVTPEEIEKTSGESQEAEELVVYMCGAVNSPGIYTLPAESRLYEALAQAGGFSAEADPTYHNLARSIADGERIYILSYAETKELSTEQQVAGEVGEYAQPGVNTLINLNTATAEQLTSLPGIGEAKAAAILAYRKQVGQFTAAEEIMNVSGIGEAMFEKIKDKITVK